MLRSGYGKDLLVLGFTKEALVDAPLSLTIDAAIGLEAPLVGVILESKPNPRSHQYDIKRLVPALTRCTHGLIVMWQEEAFYRIPWKEIKRIDGTYDVLYAITETLYYEPDARYVIQSFLRPHIHDELCLKRNDDAQLRTLEYLTVRNEIDALDA